MNGFSKNSIAILGLLCGVSLSFAITLEFSTFLGTDGGDNSYLTDINNSGEIFVSGETETETTDFPTTAGSFDNSYNGWRDVFVSKLTSDGTSLAFSTFLGGSDSDWGAFGIKLGGNGNILLGGSTQSTDFPTQSPYDPSFNGDSRDAFITILSPNGSSLIYSTYFGGSYDDECSISIDGNDNVYLAGITDSNDFPTTSGAFDTSYNGSSFDDYDIFVSKFSPNGNSLVYSTYLGGNNEDYGLMVESDGSGNAFVSGRTLSSNFPTQNAYDNSFNGGTDTGDAFVSKLSPTGSSLIYSTYLGGSSDEFAVIGFTIDGNGNAYLTGSTSSSDFPTQNSYDNSYNGGSDIFVSKLSSTGSSLIYSTFIGGSGDELGYGLSVDGSGNAFVSGLTSSSNFPTQNAYDNSYNGGEFDAFLLTLSSNGSSLLYSTYLGGSDDDYGFGISTDGNGNAYISGQTSSNDYPTTNGVYDETQNGDFDAFITKFDFSSLVKIDEQVTPLIKGFKLAQNFPNPFNPTTTINYELPTASFISLKIYNLNGELVKTLVQEKKTKGAFSEVWNGTDENGKQVSSGTYLYKLEGEKISVSKKLTLLK